MVRKRGLGRGLSDLLSGEDMSQSRAVIEIPLDEIEPNPFQPREHVEDNSLDELTVSIENHGILQPIIVRRLESGYQIIAGERRWRAARRAGLRTIPCLVQDADESTSLQIALIENLQRDDLNSIEAARGYRRLMDEFGLTQEELAQRIGKSRSAIANTLRLLDLPAEVQSAIRERTLSEGHGRALLSLSTNPEKLTALFERIVAEGLSVRETEKAVREELNPEAAVEETNTAEEEPKSSPSRPPAVRDPHIAAAEQILQSAFAAKVMIRPGTKKGGVIHIRYYDDSDLSRIIEMMHADEQGEPL